MRRSTGWCSAKAGRRLRRHRRSGPSFGQCPRSLARAFAKSPTPSFEPALNRWPRGSIRAAARRLSTSPRTPLFQSSTGANELMKPMYLHAAAAPVFASAACNAEKAGDSSAPIAQATAVKPPKGGDWQQVVAQTPAGGFVMGNPDAAVKLIEYGSMTCPHCAEFDETGVQPLIDKYV